MACALFLSVRPKYAERILQGIKTVELRRVCPAVSEGDKIVLYISSPTREVKAILIVESIICDRPEKLWREIKDKAGVTRTEFEDYFNGAKSGVAIHIRDVKELSSSISLSVLRKLWPNFMPPQNYRYVSEREFSALMNLM
jgi:predicted transcriptional regulator